MSESKKPREFYFEFMSETKEYQQLSDKPPYVRDNSFELVHVVDRESYQKAIDGMKEALTLSKHRGSCQAFSHIESILQELGEDRGDG